MPKAAVTLRQRVAGWIAGKPPIVKAPPTAMQATHRRMYAAARNSRTTGGFGSSGNSSADAEISSSLTMMRSRSRQMVRDSAYAKRARTVVVNNVIGSGVGMQAQVKTTRDALNERINSDIEAAFEAWACAEYSHTGGAMHFSDQERAFMGQVFDAGEVFIRLHFSAFGGSAVPLALELIEAERVGHDIIDPSAVADGLIAADAEVRMGVEVDKFYRPIAYWIRQRHPGDVRARPGISDRFERVLAENIIHLRTVDRWPQTRGEPWMHTVLRKLDEMNEYTGLEVQAARGAASYFATIETPEDNGVLANEEDAGTGDKVMDIEPLTVQELAPGEKLEFHSPNRPNSALDGFMRYMLREVASGVGCMYESLSRDYSVGNYSNSRMGLLDDRDGWRVLQQWWLRSFRAPLHKVWLRQAVLAGAVSSIALDQYMLDPAKFEAVRFKPRGWSWVDPTKEVAAYKEAIKGGLTTITDVIAATSGGLDIEDFIDTRKRELQMLEDAGIEVDTTVTEPVLGAAAPATAAPQPSAADQQAADDAAAEDAAAAQQTQANAGRVLAFATNSAAR